MQQVVCNIYRLGPVSMTGLALFQLVRFTPSRTSHEHGHWVGYLGYSFVAVAVIWHFSLICRTKRLKGEMVLYAILNLPPLFFLTMFYATVIMLGPRIFEALP
jgi:hypothetical protein